MATTYYVDSAMGNDTNSGTSPGSPWQTLKRVNSPMYTPAPGDTILFKCGSTWFVNPATTASPVNGITVGVSGTAGNPITWGSYGTGPNPLISGFLTTSGWTQVGTANIWTFTDVSLPSAINILTINGVPQGYGRIPKTGYNTYVNASPYSSTQIVDTTLGTTSAYNGAEVVIRKNHYNLTRATVDPGGIVAGKIIFSPAGSQKALDNYGYFFQNNINCVTKAGDWCYDATNKKISMWFDAGFPPTSFIIKVSNTDTLFSIANGKNYNVINNISFEGGNSYGIKGGYAGTNTQVNYCNVAYSGLNGIFLDGAEACTVSNNTVTDSMNMGIDLTDATNNTVLSNTVARSGMIAGMGQSTDGPNGSSAYCGIQVGFSMSASNNSIRNNTIVNIGYNGLRIDGETYLVDSNHIDSVCSVMDDGGCIYTNNPSVTTYLGRIISNNIFSNSIGATAGTDGVNQGNGIYCEDNTSNLTISNNKVFNCGQFGVFFHNSHEVTLVNNLIYNNGVSQFTITHDKDVSNNPLPVNFIIANNVFIADSPTQWLIYFRSIGTNSTAADLTQFGYCNSNYYGSFYGSSVLTPSSIVFTTQIYLMPATPLTFAGWQSITGKDISSTYPYLLIRP